MAKILVNKLFKSHAITYPALLVAFSLGTLIAGALPQPFMSPAAEPVVVAKSKATQLLGNAQTGNPELASISRLSFGPQGLLLVADARAAAIVGIDTGDVKPVAKLAQKVENIDQTVRSALGAAEAKIVDLAVNPASGRIYLAVQRGNQPVILTVDSEGGLAVFDLSKVRYARVSLPGGQESKVTGITDVQFSEDRVLAAGQCNEEFASKIYSLPVPLTHGSSADITSAETYHVSHRKWETRAPIRSFVPYVEDGKSYVVGSFSCTPIAKFPLEAFGPEAKVQGVSVVELGSGNQPLDMFTYESGGKQWLVTNTYRFHYMKNTFGPSKWWAARIDMKYLGADNVNEEAARRNVKENAGPDGMEVVDSLSGAVQVAKLSDAEAVILRNVNDEDRYDLEVVSLP